MSSYLAVIGWYIALFAQLVCDVAWVIVLFIITEKASARAREDEKIVWVIWAIGKTQSKNRKIGQYGVYFKR